MLYVICVNLLIIGIFFYFFQMKIYIYILARLGLESREVKAGFSLQA